LLALIQSLNRFLHRAENSLLIAVLLGMMLIAVVQILMRNFISTGFVWAGGFVKTCVLWTAMLGAMLACKYDKHIKIDILVRYLRGPNKRIIDGIIDIFAGSVCLLAAWFSLKFVLGEYGSGGHAFAHVPVWFSASMIPLAFFIMGGRYMTSALLNFLNKKTPL